MQPGTKLPESRKKDTLRDEKNTWKHKCEQLGHELTGAQIQNDLCTKENDMLNNGIQDIKAAVVGAFKLKPVACDGVLIVTVDDYQSIVNAVNKMIIKDR